MVALSCAQGYAQVTGKPAAVIVHVDCGTQALAGAVHNVDRCRTPVGAENCTFARDLFCMADWIWKCNFLLSILFHGSAHVGLHLRWCRPVYYQWRNPGVPQVSWERMSELLCTSLRILTSTHVNIANSSLPSKTSQIKPPSSVNTCATPHSSGQERMSLK